MKWFLLLALSIPSVALAKPTVDDTKGASQLVRILSDPEIDAETRTRLLLVGCSEIPMCAAGDVRPLSTCSKPDVSPSQCATVLASSERLDYRAQHDKDPKLTPAAWIEQHVKHVLDDIAPAVADRKAFDENRKKAKL